MFIATGHKTYTTHSLNLASALRMYHVLPDNVNTWHNTCHSIQTLRV